jgi:hypothetical protein
MIKFFRKVRQRLLTENSPKAPGQVGKFTRYLLYAIGEIVLVIIGILIALQINNNNTLRKETLELHSYLETIKNNIKGDRQQIEAMIEYRDSSRFYAQKFMVATQQEKITKKDLILMFHDQYNIFYDQYLEINPSGYEALKSSGFLGKIQNSRIEELISDYYLIVNSVAKQEKSFNDFIENMEVLGFQDKVFTKILNIYRKPEDDEYFITQQEEIKTLLNHPSLQGANFRGSLVVGLSQSYRKLLSIGEEMTVEINKIVNK